MKETDTKNIGLRGVKVADTRISDVDGEKGILIYRGYNIMDLARSSTYEEVSFILLNDHLPDKKELEKFRSELVSERGVPEALLGVLKMIPQLTHPMDVLQAAIPFLASFDPQLRLETREATRGSRRHG
jgi:citrate synthase